MEENNLNNHQKSNSNKAIIIVFVLIILGLLGFIVYDKFLQKDTKPETNTQEKDCNCPKCEECQKCESNSTTCNCSISSCSCSKVNSVKKVTITKENQTFKIGNKEYKMRIGDDKVLDEELFDILFINEEAARIDGGERVSFDNAYLTDQFMFFTGVAQDNEMIVYAYGVDGEIKFNNNHYQMEKFVIKDNYLHASGRKFCGVDDADCPSKDLIVKYIDNTLIVTEAK